jgi:hypothetical protein
MVLDLREHDALAHNNLGAGRIARCLGLNHIGDRRLAILRRPWSAAPVGSRAEGQAAIGTGARSGPSGYRGGALDLGGHRTPALMKWERSNRCARPNQAAMNGEFDGARLLQSKGKSCRHMPQQRFR